MSNDPLDKLAYKEGDDILAFLGGREVVMGRRMYAVMLSIDEPFLFHSDYGTAKDIAHDVGGTVKRVCVAFHVLAKGEKCVTA